jgi:hypothetical protein
MGAHVGVLRRAVDLAIFGRFSISASRIFVHPAIDESCL